ncbi:MAG TPA: fluoride efflux transporter CrcB [Pyrinomonadaceae bacterium]|nr:fluoride efflux transporter CrcB [Pyrinomonadaceae bacterium]
METAIKILAVAIGGAFGAVLRYLINISPMQDWLKPFPFPTFFINICGSFLIGLALIFFSEKFGASETLRLALVVGFLGAFTTFSTFEFEIWMLIEESRFLTAFLYLFLSVSVGFIGVALGVWLAKKF